ncbi:MAG: T9SS type A sorting domain-containing protein, partial [Candidatus Cloacimonetes bacterium]|nr:T9SS type A sorting domain-containing protein [Candidatus Cloacimonadota bacterium]
EDLTVYENGEISFWKKVSSELNYDYLKFFIDEILQEQWSGEVDWSESIFFVNAGFHTFKWEYFKDNSVFGGNDCAWIDYIVFPLVAEEVAIDEEFLLNATKLYGNYPNPFNPETTISFSLTTENTENTEINIYNIKGQKIKQLEIRNLKLGINEVIWDGKNNDNQPVASGIYFYQLNINNKVIASKKCLLLK